MQSLWGANVKPPASLSQCTHWWLSKTSTNKRGLMSAVAMWYKAVDRKERYLSSISFSELSFKLIWRVLKLILMRFLSSSPMLFHLTLMTLMVGESCLLLKVEGLSSVFCIWLHTMFQISDCYCAAFARIPQCIFLQLIDMNPIFLIEPVDLMPWSRPALLLHSVCNCEPCSSWSQQMLALLRVIHLVFQIFSATQIIEIHLCD